jgi:uncharacterized protein (DUF1330 family)
MGAYLIVEHIITDAAKFEAYRTKVEPLIAKHGGRYITKGGSHKMPEGGHWKSSSLNFPTWTRLMLGTARPNTSRSLPFTSVNKVTHLQAQRVFLWHNRSFALNWCPPTIATVAPKNRASER